MRNPGSFSYYFDVDQIKRTMCGCEISVLSSDVLELSSSRVQDLDVAGQVSVPIYLAELVKLKVCHVAKIEFVIS